MEPRLQRGLRLSPRFRRLWPRAAKCRLTWANALDADTPDPLSDGRCQAIREQYVSTPPSRGRPGASAGLPPLDSGRRKPSTACWTQSHDERRRLLPLAERALGISADRQRVVWGKGVSVRLK